MINKDSNYLNEKLNELKKSVLNKNQQISQQIQQGDQRNEYYESTTRNYTYQQEQPKPYSRQQQPQKYSSLNQDFKMSFAKQEPRIIKAQDDIHQSFKYQSPQQYTQYKYNDLGMGKFDNEKFKVPYQENNFKSPNVDKSILDSVMKQTTMKRETDMVNDLNLRLQEETNMNSKLKAEIQSLQTQFEREKIKLDELDQILSDELKRSKIKENEVIQEFHEMENKKQQLIQDVQREEDRRGELNSHMDNLTRENDMLKNELKRFGEMTSEKILELENGINNIGRMRDFEKENFNMEKEKIMNHCEFVLEQIKTQSNERELKIQEELRKTQQEQSKADRELDIIVNELRNFDGIANQQINNNMRQIIEEETTKQKESIQQIDDQIREYEHEINSLNTDNQKTIQHFQDQERDFKSKLINLRNRNTRLKEEFSNLEDEHNRLMIRLKSDAKEINNQTVKIDRLHVELEDIINKTNLLEANFKEEIDGASEHHLGVIRELEDMYQQLIEREREISEEIRSESLRMQEMERKHHEILEDLQHKLNNTLNN